MLKEIMNNLDTTIFAEIALLLFLLAFIGIVVQTLRRPREEMDTLSRLPIDNDKIQKQLSSERATD